MFYYWSQTHRNGRLHASKFKQGKIIVILTPPRPFYLLVTRSCYRFSMVCPVLFDERAWQQLHLVRYGRQRGGRGSARLTSNFDRNVHVVILGRLIACFVFWCYTGFSAGQCPLRAFWLTKLPRCFEFGAMLRFCCRLIEVNRPRPLVCQHVNTRTTRTFVWYSYSSTVCNNTECHRVLAACYFYNRPCLASVGL